MFSGIPKTAQNNLLKLATEVAGMTPICEKTWKISTETLDRTEKSHAAIDEVRAWEGNHHGFLYYFVLTNEADLSEVGRAYTDNKAKSDRAFARFIRQSKWLYVGGSQNISQRLKEHLGFGARGTYAVQLVHWAQDLRLDLEFTCARYRDDVRCEVLQALEDTLWDELRPMLGRRGKR